MRYKFFLYQKTSEESLAKIITVGKGSCCIFWGPMGSFFEGFDEEASVFILQFLQITHSKSTGYYISRVTSTVKV